MISAPLLSDSELLTLLSLDQEEAFTELYRRYWYTLYAKAVRKIGRKDIAEEMAQQLFANLWQKRHSLHIENLNAYLHGALKNLIVDYVRKNIQEEHYLQHLQLFFPPQHISPGSEIQYQELTEAINLALHQLPAKTQQVFRLSRFDQLTIPEIARSLTLSEKAIEYHLTRALSFLRKNLREFITLWCLLLD